MGKTKIEWADKVWNPVTGCTKVSQGCANCYAAREFPRVYPGREFTDVRTHPDRLDQPLRWTKPCRIFVDSMGDLFHEKVPDKFIDQVFAVATRRPGHTFQILTKRPERMHSYLTDYSVGLRWAVIENLQGTTWGPEVARVWTHNGLPNVWLGVSVEDQQTADERIPLLLRTQAALRFVSYEPALGPVTLKEFIHCPDDDGCCSLCGDYHEENNPSLNWVIAGGESGPDARPSHPDWFRSVRDQCQAAGVPFFFKQWGEFRPLGSIVDNDDSNSGLIASANEGKTISVHIDGSLAWRGDRDDPCFENLKPYAMEPVGKKRAGRLLDGREWNEFPATRSADLRG